jgi:hypothetical protein
MKEPIETPERLIGSIPYGSLKPNAMAKDSIPYGSLRPGAPAQIAQTSQTQQPVNQTPPPAPPPTQEK